jgi:type II secretory pathway component PulC
MMFGNQFFVSSVDLGAFSDAAEYAPIEIYSFRIEEEETKPPSEPDVQASKEATEKVEDTKTTKQKVALEKKKTENIILDKPSKEITSPDPKKTKNKQASISSVLKRKKVARAKSKRTAKNRSRCPKRSNRRVQSISGQEFSLQKDLVDTYLNSISNAQKLAKAYWYKGKKGKGILLQQIPCKSPLRNIGLKPKDIIMAVNGKTLTNNAELLSSYIQLKSKKNIDILLKRGTRQFTLTYQIVKRL